MEAINPIVPGDLSAARVETFRDARSEEAFKDLEALFINELLKEMRRTIPNEGMFKKSHATEMYEAMLDEVFSKAMADSEQFGIAKQIAAQVQLREEGAVPRPEAQEYQADVRPEALKERAQGADKTYTAARAWAGE